MKIVGDGRQDSNGAEQNEGEEDEEYINCTSFCHEEGGRKKRVERRPKFISPIPDLDSNNIETSCQVNNCPLYKALYTVCDAADDFMGD